MAKLSSTDSKPNTKLWPRVTPPPNAAPLQPACRRDLEDIADYIEQSNPARVVSYVREMREHCRRPLAFPESAPLRPELGPSVRMRIIGNHLIL